MDQVVRPEAQAAMRVAIWLLFLVYCAPLLVAAYVYVLSGFGTKSPALEWFVSFARLGDQSLSLVHRALLPLMAGLAPIAFSDRAATNSSLALMAVLIGGIALSIFLSAAMNDPSAQAALKSLSLFPVTDANSGAELEAATATGLALIASFFNRTQETLGMYLLMLFGLTLTTRS